jgi:hypothetical protein
MGRRLEQQSMLRVLSALACSAYVFFTFTFRIEGVEHGGTGDSIDLPRYALRFVAKLASTSALRNSPKTGAVQYDG